MRLSNVASVAVAFLVSAVACAGPDPMLFDIASLQSSQSVSVDRSGGTGARHESAGVDVSRAIASSTATLTGFVRLEDGSPVADAVIVSALGGQAVSKQDGSFTLRLKGPTDMENLGLTAVATAKGVTYTGNKLVPLLEIDGRTDSGVIMLSSGGSGMPTCAELAWLPTFGGATGLSGGPVAALAVFDDGLGGGPALYAGGWFTNAGGMPANRVAKWNAASEMWMPLGSGMSGGSSPSVNALTVFDDGLGGGPALYAGGEFTSAGGVAANRIARWNAATETWSPIGGGIGGGFSPRVNALCVFDDGLGNGPTLIAGGSFTTAGGVAANRIARWSASTGTWSALGSGMGGGTDPSGNPPHVLSLTSLDDGSGAGPVLYAGGWFSTAGGITVNNIARWNASTGTWSALASGTNSHVHTLVVLNDRSGGRPALYAGGSFTTAGGATTVRIAQWDASTGMWSPLGSGMNNSVLALAVFDDGSGSGPALYAGGFFTTAGGISANQIARWNVDSETWSPLEGFGGPSHAVRALAFLDDDLGEGQSLYAGGQFNLISDGVYVTNIARWNEPSESWMSLGGFAGMNHWVRALAVFDDGLGSGPALYAGGWFTTAGGVPANRIAKWNADTETWSPLSSGMSGGSQTSVNVLTVYDDGLGDGPALYAGGDFSVAGGVNANCIAKWDGAVWSALGSGTSGGGTTGASVHALTEFDDGMGGGPALYAGGQFTIAGGTVVNRIAKWDAASGTWSSLGSGLGGGFGSIVYALTVFDDGSGAGPALYAGGSFTTAGGVAVNRIARWTNSSGGWSALGSGVSDTVQALAVFDDGLGGGPALYAGGWFTTAGGVAADRIAKWSGTQWSALGSGLTGGPVHTLATFDDGFGSGPALHAGGDFVISFFQPDGYRIARWNPATASWLPLGSGGMNATVSALVTFDDGMGGGSALYAGGLFTHSPSFDSYVARWGCEGDAPCAPADLNCDGAVDGNDLAIVLGGWGPCGSPCIADINDDGIVDGNDLAIVLGAWG